MTAHSFGVTCFVLCANHALCRTSELSGTYFNESVLDNIKTNFYADDSLTSFVTKAEEVVSARNAGASSTQRGLRLRKWTSIS